MAHPLVEIKLNSFLYHFRRLVWTEETKIRIAKGELSRGWLCSFTPDDWRVMRRVNQPSPAKASTQSKLGPGASAAASVLHRQWPASKSRSTRCSGL
jgi:hypothetical protein